MPLVRHPRDDVLQAAGGSIGYIQGEEFPPVACKVRLHLIALWRPTARLQVLEFRLVHRPSRGCAGIHLFELVLR